MHLFGDSLLPRRLLALMVLLGLAPAQHSALAQSRYPDKPIRLVIPFAPGGETDLIGRLWAQRTAPYLAQSVVVDNKGGAGGAIGALEVARAKADGYTLLVGTSGTHVVNPLASSGAARFDPARDFAPVTLVSLTAFTIVVSNAVPARNLQELISLMRNNPGKYAWASAGTGSMAHLAGEMFRMQTGNPDIPHVPYKGAGPALQDLIAGHVPVGMMVLTKSLQALHKSGKLRILSLAHEQRLDAISDVPTTGEAGLPEMKVAVFNGIFAPAGTAPVVIDTLYQATRRAMQEGGLARELETAGAQVLTDAGPERSRRFVEDEVRKWTPVVRASGIRLE